MCHCSIFFVKRPEPISTTNFLSAIDLSLMDPIVQAEKENSEDTLCCNTSCVKPTPQVEECSFLVSVLNNSIHNPLPSQEFVSQEEKPKKRSKVGYRSLRHSWTVEEDNKLRELVEKYNKKHWKLIARGSD